MTNFTTFALLALASSLMAFAAEIFDIAVPGRNVDILTRNRNAYLKEQAGSWQEAMLHFSSCRTRKVTEEHE